MSKHPDEQPTRPFPGPGGPSTPARHPSQEVTVSYKGGHKDEHATEVIHDDVPGQHTRRLDTAALAHEVASPTSAIVNDRRLYERPAAPERVPGSKSRLTTVLLALFLGGLGAHRFYLGYNGLGLAYLIGTCFLSILTFGLLIWVGPLIGVIEAALYLLIRKGYWSRDQKGRPLYD